MTRYFRFTSGGGVWPERKVNDTSKANQVVVIDPEDREQVQRLARCAANLPGVYTSAETRLRAALREFANPQPPKLEEPTGLGAVVEDASGGLWFRMTVENQTWPGEVWQQQYSDADRWSKWPDIEAVRVLSEGVS